MGRKKVFKACAFCMKEGHWGYNKYCSQDCRLKATRRWAKEHRTKKKLEFYRYKEQIGCSLCGYNKCGAALDFHHPNDNKERAIILGG